MYLTQDISKALKGDSIINISAVKISRLLTDSRKLEIASESLFFAISGERLDGHHYIDELYQKGVRNFVIENARFEEKYENANFWIVKSAIEALQQLAQLHRLKFDFPIVGITGSNGKTIVKEWCHQLLQDNYTIVRSPKSYNSQIGVPLSVWNIEKKHDLGIFEAGISQPDEMANLQKIIQPDIGIFTNIGAAHGANFLSIEHKIKEKLNLFTKSKVLIYNNDYALIHKSIVKVFNETHKGDYKPTLLSWGKNNQAVIKVEKQFSELLETKVQLSYDEKQFMFTIPFIDASSVENALHCVVLMIYLNFPEERINEQLQKIQRIAMRLEQKQGIHNCLIINDSYNSDIDSLKIALDFLLQQQLQSSKTVILSDILQSGISPYDLYQRVFDLLENAEINRFIGIGKELKLNKNLLDKSNKFESTFFESTQDFLERIHEFQFREEAILLKGARKFQFEEIGKYLEEKAHSTVLEINLNAIVHNLHFFNSLLKPDTKTMAMVKAFSYGSGAYELAKLLEFHRVDYLGVAYTDEGVSLRNAGIKTPILVLNPEIYAFDILIRNQLEPEIYSFKMLNAFVEAIKKAKLIDAYPIQINLETGMKRLGFEASEITSLIDFLKNNTSSIKVKGIFSHLAAADDETHDDFTKQQIANFEKWSIEISKALDINPLRHLSNTNGILRFPNANFDMVRLGIGLHGIASASYSNKLQTASTLKSSISQIKDLKKGESVGYSRTFVANKNMKIATISVGYADGLNRKLSQGKGNVFLHGKKAPIIGNICMDMCMIDVSSIHEATEGDMVEIFGENITVNELAKSAETISYEILTNVSERVKRIYFWD